MCVCVYIYIYIYILHVTYFVAVCCKEILVSAPKDGEIMKTKTCRRYVKIVHKLWNIAFVDVT